MIVTGAFARKVKVKRIQKGAYDSQGIYVAGKTQTFDIQASVQPLGGKEMQYLSEGTRFKEGLKLYTDTKLRVVSEDKSAPADRVVIDGIEYEVSSVQDWSQHLTLKHYKVIVLRDNRQDEPTTPGAA